MLPNATRETHGRMTLGTPFFIFALLAVSSAATIGQQTPAKQETTIQLGPQARPDSKLRTTFVLRRISDGILCPKNNLNCEEKDIWWKNFTLLAPDGHTLDLTSIPFLSVERSKKQFDLTIKEAEKIIRRNFEMNSKGEQVGERALGFFPEIKDIKPPSDVPHYKLFWMWSTNYWEIIGAHLDDVLALEERLNEEGVNAVWGWRATVPLRPD